MIRKYLDASPEYLRGENFCKHASIIDSFNKSLDDKLDLLQSWNVLERHILVERVQTVAGSATINIHVNTDTPIKSIKIGTTTEAEYTEEELVTSTVITKEYTDSHVPIIMPDLVVTVETYDGRVYVKGYPENDIVKNNVKDHDEFLDIVGRLLGIPRRTYIDVAESQDPDEFKGNYPPYFTKTVLANHNTGVCTEDDYYYSQRLQKFLDGLDRKDFVVHMADVLYEWQTSSIVHCKNRSNYLYDELEEVVGENAEYDLLVTDIPRYSNLDYTNIQQIISNYHPVTRLIFALTRKFIEWTISNFSFDGSKIVFYGVTDYSEGSETYDVYKCTFLADYISYKFSSSISGSPIVIATEGHSTNATTDKWTGNTRSDWYKILFVRIRFRPMYECLDGNNTDHTWYNLYTLSNYGDTLIIATVLKENEEDNTFSLDNWTGTSSTGGIDRSIIPTQDGTVLYLGNNCNNHSIPLPDSDWCIHLRLDRDRDSNGTSNTLLSIYYRNMVDGSTIFEIDSDYGVTIKEYSGSTLVDTTSLSDFFGRDYVRQNCLVIEKMGNNLSFGFVDYDEELVVHTRTYTNLSVCGNLYIRSYDYNINLTHNNQYRIGELNSDKTDLPVYKENEWAFISRGDGSTEPVMNDDGTIQCGKYIIHTWKQAIQTNKKYNIYVYKSTVYGYMNAGISNNNTTLPSGISSVQVNQASGAVAGINKITIYYDTTTQKWYLQYNDDSSTIKELTNNNVPRYLIISTQATVKEEQKILAITEETNE